MCTQSKFNVYLFLNIDIDARPVYPRSLLVSMNVYQILSQQGW